MIRQALEQLDATAARPEEAFAALAFLAGDAVPIDEDELHGARRRALLLLAAGGDPTRELDLSGRAVTALAAELATEKRRAALGAGLTELRPEATGLTVVSASLEILAGDGDLAWRAFACALLADELAG